MNVYNTVCEHKTKGWMGVCSNSVAVTSLCQFHCRAALCLMSQGSITDSENEYVPEGADDK